MKGHHKEGAAFATKKYLFSRESAGEIFLFVAWVESALLRWKAV
jgi:hypothetical protein